MMKNLNKQKLLYLFLILFSLSVGIFSNYREMWLQINGLSPASISRIVCFANIITVLIFIFFTIKVSYKKLKVGVSFTLILKLITSSLLYIINGSGNLFLIKFIMFFDIAFNDLILSSIYPLMMSIHKDNEVYTKKKSYEEISNDVGFFLVSLLIGKYFFKHLFSYNSCLLLSICFIFLSLTVLLQVNNDEQSNNNSFDIKRAIKYLNEHKIIYLFLLVNFLSSVTWKSVVGMPILSLTTNLGFSLKNASFVFLFLGIISNILAILVVKHLHFKNNHLNMVFKYGIRIILYLLTFITNNKILLGVTFIYLFVLEMPFDFIIEGYFINKVKSEYSFLMTTLKYITSLLGQAVGIYLCGLVFNESIRVIILPALIISSIHYILTTVLLNKRDKVSY